MFLGTIFESSNVTFQAHGYGGVALHTRERRQLSQRQPAFVPTQMQRHVPSTVAMTVSNLRPLSIFYFLHTRNHRSPFRTLPGGPGQPPWPGILLL